MRPRAAKGERGGNDSGYTTWHLVFWQRSPEGPSQAAWLEQGLLQAMGAGGKPGRGVSTLATKFARHLEDVPAGRGRRAKGPKCQPGQPNTRYLL